jgi:hypothetical protein
MATNRAMLKEAIADAKAVKETAIANAKAALEEAFTPQLKSMFSMKLQEMELEEMDDMKNEMYDEKSMKEGDYDKTNEVDLEELLAELEKEEDLEENLYEAEEGEEDEEEGNPVDPDMTDEELKDIIEDVLQELIDDGMIEAGPNFESDEEGKEDEEGEDMKMSDDEEDVDLAELLREIEEMEHVNEDELEEGANWFQQLAQKAAAALGFGELGNFNPVAIGWIQANAQALKDAKDKPAEVKQALIDRFTKETVNVGNKGYHGAGDKAYKSDFNDLKKLLGLPVASGPVSSGGDPVGVKGPIGESELTEAYSTIKILKNELNEINLLNAKLLYSNKIFKSKNLNESQKVKVLSSFDKANTVGEVKMVFETLNEGIKVVKTTIKENLGSASKLTSTPTAKKPIVESNDAFLRMQKLAGLI